MASFIFDNALLELSVAGGSIDFEGDTIKARLVASSVTPSRTATVMTGLTKIGTDVTLTTTAVTLNTTSHRLIYNADSPVIWTTPAAGATIGWIVVYKFVTNDGDSVPIFCEDVPNTGTNDLDIAWSISADGINYDAA